MECDSSATPPRCTADNGQGGYDCWGGASWKGCTCSSGTARLTGQTFDDSNGNVYYEYTCCDGDTTGTNVGVECGIYVAPSPSPPPPSACDDAWADGLVYMGYIHAPCTLAAAQPSDGDDMCQCSDLDGDALCDVAYRKRSDGTFARCELVNTSCTTVNRDAFGHTVDGNGKLSFSCSSSG